MRLLIVGGGRMGEALLGGLLAAGWDGLGVVEVDEARREDLRARFAGVRVERSPVVADGAVLAVKPWQVREVCGALEGTKRVLSIAAGVPIAAMEEALGAGTAVVRAMPNVAATVGAGVAAICGGTAATEGDLSWAESILTAVGTVVRVPEKQLDAVTGLAGSGPAYLFLVAEALIDAGVLNGLPRDVAVELAHRTILGAGRLLTETGDSAETLRAAVTTPGGTTAAGLHVLEANAVRAAIQDAVSAATERSRELGQ